MKALLIFTMMCFCFSTWAHPCPGYLKNNSKALKALDFLKRWPHKFVLGSCQIEIFTCSGWEETHNIVPMAEILIVDGQGREAYASLQYPVEESPYFSTQTQSNERMLHFEKTDKFFEPEFGRTEVLRLELVTQWDNPQQLKRLELGMYSTHHQLEKADGNKSEWFVCH